MLLWVWILIAFAWLFVLLLSIYNRKETPSKPKPQSEDVVGYYDKTIPKIIYTFWDSPESLPPIVEKSIDTWKKYCPDYEIRILDYENTKHMGIKHKDSHARYSDFVRLYVLAETGGIWIDASIFLQRPLDDWIKPGYDYTGYYAEFFDLTDLEFPVIESWFMAAPKGSPFIRDWKNEFFRSNEYETMSEYTDELTSKYDVDPQLLHFNLPYLAIHMAAQYCVQKLGPYTLNLLSADKDALKHVMDSPFNWFMGLPVVENLCKNIDNYKTTTNMIKITSGHRSHLEPRKSCVEQLSK